MRFQSLVVTGLMTLAIAACKKEFDVPPTADLPSLTATHTIAQIKAMDTLTSSYTQLGAGADTSTMIMEGIVVGDDRTGNFYKSIVIQDSSGGVQVRLNATNTYTDFPVGRKVWIKCNGLYIGRYNGTPQLSYNLAGDAIPETLIKKYLIGGPRDQVVTPRVVSINQLAPEHINTLIRLENVEFSGNELNTTFADAINNQSQNRTVRDCNGGSILVRTSGYATFAGIRLSAVAPGSGNLTAVYTVFGADKQLYIRDTFDVSSMTGTRCTGGGGGTGNVVTVRSIRQLFASGTTTVPADYTIRGYVISDINNGNTDNRNVVLQDTSAGITLRFTSNQSFQMGDELSFNIGGGTMSEFNGLLQLTNVDAANATVLSSGNFITPRTLTVAQLNSDLEQWESTLIRVNNATITGGSTYSGSRTLGDGTGTITLFTRSQATFAGTAVPGGSVEVTGILSQFNSGQVQMRTLGDVVGGSPIVTNLITIDSLRRQFTVGGLTTVSGTVKIRGVVSSDRTTSNIVSQNITIQDGTAGITVRFSANHSLNMGDSVEIVVSGGTLGEFNGLLQVSNLATSTATTLSTGVSISPRVITVADLNNNAIFETVESMLVEIQGATITGGTTYGASSGNLTVNQSGQTITLYTRASATFAGSTVPTGTVTVKAVVGQFNTTKQLSIRGTSDVQ